jgi:hypothetical protein
MPANGTLFGNAFLALETSGFGTWLSANAGVLPWLEVAHIASFALLIGSVGMVNVRLMGVASRDYPLEHLARALLPITWLAFVFALVTGLLLLAPEASTHWASTAFRVKLLLLLAAGVNMANFNLVLAKNMARWDLGARTPLSARLSGAVSLLLWIAIVSAGALA